MCVTLQISQGKFLGKFLPNQMQYLPFEDEKSQLVS